MKDLTTEQKVYLARANRWSIVFLVINLFFTGITVLFFFITLFYHYTNIESADAFPATMFWFLFILLSIPIGLIVAYASHKLKEVLNNLQLSQYRRSLLTINIALGIIPSCLLFLMILLFVFTGQHQN